MAVPSGCQASSPAPAYQVTNNGGSPVCYNLGSSYAPQTTQASLYDSTDPGKGWQLTYTGGSSSFCPSGVSRSFSIVFRCADAPFPSAQGSSLWDASIDEVNTCGYTALSYSTAGCPLECPVVGGRLCGGNGVCGYDSNIHSARCFCYDNFMEADCQTPRYPFPSGSVAGATIAGILLGAAGVLGYAWYNGRKQAHMSNLGGFYTSGGPGMVA